MITIVLFAALVQAPQPPLPAIQVTASPAVVLPVTTLDSAQLRRDVRPSLAVVTSAVPGVRAVTTGTMIAKPLIRGLGGARVLMLDGGSRLEDYSWSDEDGPSLDPRLSERIEVIRGPASLLYGSDAIGGVVNSIPEALIEAAPGQRVRRLRTELFGASNNPGVGAGANAAWARNALSARLNLVGHFAGPTSTPVCELENTGFSSLNGEAAVGVHGSSGRASLRISRFAGEFKLLEAGGAGFSAPAGCPGGPPKPAVEAGGPERKVDDLRVQMVGETRWHGLNLEARTQIQHHGTIELSDDVTPGVETETINLGLTTETVDLLAHHHIGAADGTFGMSGMLQSNTSTGLAPLVPNGTLHNAAVYIIERLPIGPLSLLAGIRGDVRGLHADSNATLQLGAQTRNASAVTGDFGAVVELTHGVSLAANVGRAFRAPNLFELFSNGPRLGEARYEIGDPTMKPEVSLNFDASIRWHVSRFRGELAAFHNRIDHFSFITPASTFHQTGTVGQPDSLRDYFHGQAQATLLGGEASLAVEATDRISIWGRADAVRGQNDTQGGPLPLMPPLRAVTGARYHTVPGTRRAWYAGAEVEGVDRQNRLASYNIPGQGATVFDIPTAGYVLLGFEGGYELQWGNRLVSIDVRVRNATNQQYRNYLNRYKEFALDAGRAFEVRLATEF